MTHPEFRDAAWRERLRQNKVRRARKRKHRPCPEHGAVKRVCGTCARVNCPSCVGYCFCGTVIPPLRGPQMPAKPITAPAKTPTEFPVTLPAAVQQLFDGFLKKHGALHVAPHPESGEWMALFPFRLAPYTNAGEVLAALEAAGHPGFATTSFGAGRLTEPDRWFVTFQTPPKSTP